MEVHWAAFGALEQAVRTGRPAFDQVTGVQGFDYFTAHPEEGALFDQAMAAKASGQIGPVLKAYDFSSFARIGDIGGGQGHLLRAVLSRAPEASGVLLDLPAVAARAAPHDRIQIIGGDFFSDQMPVCDLYLMMSVLHDWADDEAAAILANLRRAAPPQARLLLIEAVLAPPGGGRDDYDMARMIDIEMLVMTHGRERTRAEWAAVLSDGGWRLERVLPAGPWSGIIEAAPA